MGPGFVQVSFSDFRLTLSHAAQPPRASRCPPRAARQKTTAPPRDFRVRGGAVVVLPELRIHLAAVGGKSRRVVERAELSMVEEIVKLADSSRACGRSPNSPARATTVLGLDHYCGGERVNCQF